MPYGPKRLTAEQAERLRGLYATGRYTQQRLARLFKVSQPLVSKIVNREVHKPSLSFGGAATCSVRKNFVHPRP